MLTCFTILGARLLLVSAPRSTCVPSRSLCPFNMIEIRRKCIDYISFPLFCSNYTAFPIEHKFYADYRALGTTVSKYIIGLPSFESFDSQGEKSYMLSVQSIAEASVIQLYNFRSDVDRAAHDVCISSARTILDMLEYVVRNDMKFLDPAIGVSLLLSRSV